MTNKQKASSSSQFSIQLRRRKEGAARVFQALCISNKQIHYRSNDAMSSISAAEVRRLFEAHPRSLLALKAYEKHLLSHAGDTDCDVYLADFVLHCNCFALGEMRQDDGSIELSRDFFRLALQVMEREKGVQTDWESLIGGTTGIRDGDGHPSGGLPFFTVPSGTDGATLALLALTVSNWAGAEIVAQHVQRGIVLLLASRSIVIDDPSLAFPIQAAQAYAAAVGQVLLCSFPEAEADLLAASAVLEAAYDTSASRDDDGDGARMPHCSTDSALSDLKTLQSAIYYTLGVAQEYDSSEKAVKAYSMACESVSEVHDTSQKDDLKRRYVQAEEWLSNFINEAKSKQTMMEAAESTAKRDTRLRPKGGPTAKKVGGKRRSVHSAEPPAPSFVPPISSALRVFLRTTGLRSNLMCFYRLDDCLKQLTRSASGECGFVSPLPTCGTLASNVVGVVVCAQTPLELAVEVQHAEQGGRSLKSVFASWRTVGSSLPLSVPPLAEETTRRMSKAPTAPRPPPKTLLHLLPVHGSPQNAQKGVGNAVKLLSQRLGVLIKAERLFEERWVATERIRSALTAFSALEHLKRLRLSLLEKKRLEEERVDRSARTLVRFFRRLVREKPSQLGFLSEDQRRAKQRSDAAVVLQKYTRRWIALRARQELHAQHQLEERRIVVVQSLFRRKLAVRAYACAVEQRTATRHLQYHEAKQVFAAIQIQRAYRQHRLTLGLLRANGHPHEATLRHFRDSRHYYATLIQKRVRGMLVRREYGALVRARLTYGRNIHRKQQLDSSCLTIQRYYRGYRARRNLRRLLHSRRVLAVTEGEAVTSAPLAHGQSHADSALTSAEAATVRAAIVFQRNFRRVRAQRKAAELRLLSQTALYERRKEQRAPFCLSTCTF